MGVFLPGKLLELLLVLRLLGRLACQSHKGRGDLG